MFSSIQFHNPLNQTAMKVETKLVISLSLAVIFQFSANGQYADEAFRYSQITQSGTARFQGLGGNHAALGGDASAGFGNPAGLAFYNRSELSISPAATLFGTNSSYLKDARNAGTNTSDSKSNPNIAHIGLILAGEPNNYNRKWRRTTIGVTYSRQNTFQNTFSYGGRNNASSIVDNILERANRRNINSTALDNEFSQNTNSASSLEAAAYQLYLFDPTNYSQFPSSDPRSSGVPYRRSPLDRNTPTDQSGQFVTTGAATQWTFTYAGNYEDRLYVGGSIGLSSVKFGYQHTLREQFVGAKQTRGVVYNENLRVSGGGINVSIGAIYKVTDNIQIGATLLSPSFTSIKETFDEAIEADFIGVPILDNQGRPTTFVPSLKRVEVQAADFEYNLRTPLVASGGLTYFFGKKGFLTGSAEYVNYSGMRVSTSFYNNSSENTAFRNDYRTQISNTFQNVLNVRVGAEARLGSFRVRAGGAVLGNPYQTRNSNPDRGQVIYSAGGGYRNDRFFVDISGSYTTYQTPFTPYRLNDTARFSAVATTNNMTNVVLSVGTFF